MFCGALVARSRRHPAPYIRVSIGGVESRRHEGQVVVVLGRAMSVNDPASRQDDNNGLVSQWPRAILTTARTTKATMAITTYVGDLRRRYERSMTL
jgi:hypothetical protein